MKRMITAASIAGISFFMIASVSAEDLDVIVDSRSATHTGGLLNDLSQYFTRQENKAELNKNYESVRFQPMGYGSFLLDNVFREEILDQGEFKTEKNIEEVDILAKHITFDRGEVDSSIGFDNYKLRVRIANGGVRSENDDVHRVINIGKKGAGVESITILGKYKNDYGLIHWRESTDNKEVNLYADTINMAIMPNSNTYHRDNSLISVYRSNNAAINLDATKRIELHGGLEAGFSAYRNQVVQTQNIKININQDKENSPDVIINSDIFTYNMIYKGSEVNSFVDNHWIGNQINIRMNTPKSIYTGKIIDYKESDYTLDENDGTHLDISNGAVVNITDVSSINYVNLRENGKINMVPNTAFKNLYINNLEGEHGSLILNIDATKRDKTDHLVIEGIHKGIHYINLRDMGNFSEAVEGTGIVYVKDEQGEFRANDEEGTLYWDTYALEKTIVEGKKYPYVWSIKTAEKSTKPTPTMNSILAANWMEYYLWRSNFDSLHERLGDLRQASKSTVGAWVKRKRVSGHIHNPYDIEYNENMYEIGYDGLYKSYDKKGIYYGLSFKFSNGHTIYINGSGEEKSYGLNLYRTSIHEDGTYLDLVFSVSRWSNNFEGISKKKTFTGTAKMNAISLSAEYGKRIELADKLSFETEIQGMVGYLKNISYATSNAVSVNRDRTVSLSGRLGGRLVKEFDVHTKLYLQMNYFYDMTKPNHVTLQEKKDIRVVSDSYKSSWLEYGIGITHQFSDNYLLYVDVFASNERSDSGKKINWGLRYNF